MNIKGKHIHLIGIGGTGMSGIATILLDLGYQISGSDLQNTATTKRLANKGAMIYKGHHQNHILGANLVVISSAIHQENKEVVAARKNNIEIIPRAEMLSRIMKQGHRIAISGTHGKTTITSMISLILERMNLNPTIAIGGEVNDIGGNAKLGKGDYMVVEADESDGSFLLLNPNLAIVANIENDHLDYYTNLEKTIKSFEQFIKKIPDSGCLVYGYDCPNTRELIKNKVFKKEMISYGFHEHAQLKAANTCLSRNSSVSEVYLKDQKLGILKLQIPGFHNISNALAAIATTMKLGIKFEDIAKILFSFKGVKRRQEVIYNDEEKLMIMDDYGHHPTEIKATLEAVHKGWPGRRMITIFQPHRYSRTQFLFEQFADAFSDTDMVIINDIYAANEKPIPHISAELVYQKIREKKKEHVYYLPGKKETIPFLMDKLSEGDIVLTMGAGDVWKIGKELTRQIKNTQAKMSIGTHVQ